MSSSPLGSYCWRTICWQTGRLLSLGLLACGLTLCAGCTPPEEITSYDVPHTEPDRLLAAIVERPSELWFFKAAAPKAEIDPLTGAVHEFIASLRFTPDRPEPEWTLPESWKQKPGVEKPFKTFATIEIPTSGKPIAMSISRLPRPETAEDEKPRDFLLENLNRWRRQLMLPDIRGVQIPDRTKMVKIDGGVAYWIDWAGTQIPPRSMPGAQAPAMAARSAPETDEGASATWKYKLPEGWRAAKKDPFSQLAFEAGEGEQKIRVTISQVGGGLLQNVNRWRNQLGLKPLADVEELKPLIKRIKIGASDGILLAFSANEKAQQRNTIMVAILQDGGGAWFIKLSGSSELAGREEKHFQEFVGSLTRGDEAPDDAEGAESDKPSDQEDAPDSGKVNDKQNAEEGAPDGN